MKKIFLIFASVLFVIISCDRKPSEPDNNFSGICITGGFTDLTEISANLQGVADLPSGELESVELGFVYSTENNPRPENGTAVPGEGLTASGQFNANLTGLISGTTYYYCAYFRKNGEYVYGGTKSFTTKDIRASVVTGDALGVTLTSATLTSSCSFTNNVLPPLDLISFLYYFVSDNISDREQLIASGQRIRAEANDGKSEATLENLKGNTVYYYVVGYSIKGLNNLVYGEVKQFFTSDHAEGYLHKCSESVITDDMIFSSCCSRRLTAVQQWFDYDPVDNTLYFSQLNRWYRNIVSWTEPKVTLSEDVPSQYMGLSCFSHGNNMVFERTASGEKFIWAPNFGSRGNGSYGNPWIVSRIPLQTTSTLSDDIPNTVPDDNYFFGVSPCWPAIDFDEDLIAICTYKKVYVYRLSEIRALPKTTVKIPAEITYGGIISSTGSTTTYDSGLPEFTGYPEVVARDATQVTPLIVFDISYSKRGLHWQTFCIDNGKAYFLHQGEVPDDSIVRCDPFIEVYDLKTGELLRQKVHQEYMMDVDGLASRGFVESDFCYTEPEGIKVMGEVMYVMYTCRGNTNITTRRPVIFKLSSEI